MTGLPSSRVWTRVSCSAILLCCSSRLRFRHLFLSVPRRRTISDVAVALQGSAGRALESWGHPIHQSSLPAGERSTTARTGATKANGHVVVVSRSRQRVIIAGVGRTRVGRVRHRSARHRSDCVQGVRRYALWLPGRDRLGPKDWFPHGAHRKCAGSVLAGVCHAGAKT